jgi:hypothetical protein
MSQYIKSRVFSKTEDTVGFSVTTPCCHISEEQAYVSQVGKVLSYKTRKQHKCYNFKVEEYKNDRCNHSNLIYKKKVPQRYIN